MFTIFVMLLLIDQYKSEHKLVLLGLGCNNMWNNNYNLQFIKRYLFVISSAFMRNKIEYE